MTMHLDKRLSTISARKRKSMPVTINAKLVKDFREHNKLMKRCRLPENSIEFEGTWEDFLQYCMTYGDWEEEMA